VEDIQSATAENIGEKKRRRIEGETSAVKHYGMPMTAYKGGHNNILTTSVVRIIRNSRTKQLNKKDLKPLQQSHATSP